MIHFQTRDYNPTLGTWMQQDPAGYVDGMSLYRMERSNPTNTVDPWGLAGVPSMPWLTPGQALAGEAGQATPFGWLIDIGLGAATGIGVIMNGYAAYRYREFHQSQPGWHNPNAAVVLHNEQAADANEAKSCPTQGEKAAENAKAPGKPTAADGYVPPKRGLGSKGELVKNPKGGGRGYIDQRGNIWIPTGPGPLAHGGPHWDVQLPDGGYINVYPGGKIRPGR